MWESKLTRYNKKYKQIGNVEAPTSMLSETNWFLAILWNPLYIWQLMCPAQGICALGMIVDQNTKYLENVALAMGLLNWGFPTFYYLMVSLACLGTTCICSQQIWSFRKTAGYTDLYEKWATVPVHLSLCKVVTWNGNN
jgi:hypothetical protein